MSYGCVSCYHLYFANNLGSERLFLRSSYMNIIHRSEDLLKRVNRGLTPGAKHSFLYLYLCIKIWAPMYLTHIDLHVQLSLFILASYQSSVKQ